MSVSPLVNVNQSFEDPLQKNEQDPEKAQSKPLITHPIFTEQNSSIQNSQLDQIKQKDSFVKGYGPSQYHSSGTLQNSIQSVSFSKAVRWPRSNLLASNNETFKNDNALSTLSQRSTFIGYGEKACYPSYTLKMAKDYPAPNNYLVKSEFDLKNKGKSFGLSFKAYTKVKLPHIDVLSPENAKYIPGPGSYNVRKDDFGKEKPKALFLGKGKTINDLIKEKAPPPNYYTPQNSLVTNSRYKSMTFGSGQRNTFKEYSKTPGPGSYNLKSKFDFIVEKNRFFRGFHEES